jgi:hypothetical protein
MSRGPHNVRQSDVAKAFKVVVKSGVKGWRVEVEGGKVVIRRDDDRTAPVTEDGGEWD